MNNFRVQGVDATVYSTIHFIHLTARYVSLPLFLRIVSCLKCYMYTRGL